MLWYILGTLTVIATILVVVDIRKRKYLQRNLYIDADSNVAKPIPFRDPLVAQAVALTRLFSGRARGKKAIEDKKKDFSKDINGSSQLRLLQSSFLNFNFVSIWDADIGRSVLFAKDTDLTKPDFGGLQANLLGDSILQTSGEVWKLHKNALSPAFKWDHIRASLPCFIDIANELAENLKKHSDKPIEIYNWVQRATLDAIGRGGFGHEFHAMREGEERSPEIQNYEALMKEFENPIHIFEKLDKLTGGYNRFKDLMSKFEAFMASLIAIKREAIQNAAAKNEEWAPKDILDFLLFSRDGDLLTDLQIARDLNTFFVAGHETTAGALSNTIHFLAENPECQRKAREEVLSVCGNNPPSHEDIQKMEYINNCIKESLRLFPPAIAVARSVEQDQQVGNLFLAKGSLALVHVYLIHHDPHYWGEDVEAFNPDRFTTENSKNRHRYAWMPFSIGPRQCIGNNFAMLEMRSFLAVLLQRFEFEKNPNSKEAFSEFLGIVLRPPPHCTLLLKSIEQ